MHSGFTHPDFRGRRLHGIGMARALNALSDRGGNALVSEVDWANYASLKSCARLGYRMLGNLYAIGYGCFFSISKAARKPGISFKRETVAELQNAETTLNAA